MLAAAILLAAPGLGASAPDARESNFVKSLNLAPQARVEYRDESGRKLTFNEFFKLVVAGRGFEFTHDKSGASATISISSPKKLTSQANRYKLSAGDAFPPFHLKDTHGNSLSNSALHGRLTLLNFFFAECGPCIAELPTLNEFARSRSDIRSIGITYDSLKDARQFASQRHFEWPILVGAGDLIDSAGVLAYPTIALIGPDGRVLGITTSSEIAGKEGKLSTRALSAWVDRLARPVAR